MGTTGQSITLANSIIGVGILAMPFCFQQCGVLLATLTLVVMGLVSRLCCYFLLKSAFIARRRNFEFLAFHVFGSAGKLAVELGIIGFLMGTCIAYFVVVGDLGPQIIAKMFNINQSDILRTCIMVIVSVVCVLPLGLLRNVDSLSNVSAATIGFYCCLVVKVISEAASQLLVADWSSNVRLWRPAGLLQCVPIFSMALFCQTQLFEIFESLPSLSLEKMNVVTKNAINICSGVYFTLGMFGYIAFNSQNISGNILMSLSPTMASDAIKLGFVMSLAFSFPLVIFPCRASLYSFLYKKVHGSHHDHIINNSIPETSFRCITITIIGVSLLISLLIPNIELVLGLVGATIGVLICLVFPAAAFLNVTFRDTSERLLAKFVVVLGLIIMVLGTYANLQAAENSVERYDDKLITQERIDKIVEDFFQSQKAQKSEEIMIKPIIDNEPAKEENSLVLPPNPVPPDSSQDKKPDIIEVNEIKEEKIVQKESNRISDTHPKNINKPAEVIKESKEPKIIENNIESVPKNTEDKEKSKLVQEKNDDIVKKQLIETIKQHGVEQKELLKEQKEILDEIKKTKEEINNNKKEVDSIEAKKIAVESIQKIANVAIKSLSGVSDKPNENAAPVDNVENLEAVKEIAQKAVEAIKEIEDKQPAATNNGASSVNINVNNQPNSIQNNVNQKIESAPNIIPDANKNLVSEILAGIEGHNLQQNIYKKDVQNQPIPVKNVYPKAIVHEISEKIKALQNNVKQEESNKPNIENVKNNPIPPQQPEHIPKKEHIHTADEPKSYIQGEDSQSKIISNSVNIGIAENVPLPLAMNVNSQIVKENVNPAEAISKLEDIKPNPIVETKIKEPEIMVDSNNKINKLATNMGAHRDILAEKTNDNVQNNGANLPTNNIPNNNPLVLDNVPIRQKREVVDCSKKNLLSIEDRIVCEKLIPNKEVDLLPKVDLNQAIFPKSLSLESIHHLRSLKSYDEDERER